MGPVAELTTLIRFWTQMEKLHYPMAGDMRKSLQDQLDAAQAAAPAGAGGETVPAAMAAQEAPLAGAGEEVPL